MRTNSTVGGVLALSLALCSSRCATEGTESAANDVQAKVTSPSAAQSARASRGPSRGIELVGKFSIAADASDRSGLTGKLENGLPENRIGSFGSAIAWTGDGDRYVAIADRGPADGTVSFKNRFHEFLIHVRPGQPKPLDVDLTKTTLLVNEKGENFVGISSAYDAAHPEKGLRLDPEGIRVARDGRLFVSDEYGPFVLEFDRSGKLTGRLPVPSEFSIEHPSADKKAEIEGNKRGRVTNKGFEGLAITPDGNRLYALLEAPLIQDHGKKGVNCRMVEIDLKTKKTRQYVLPLDESKHCFNELVAIDDHRFLAIERDTETGADARSKKIVQVDIEGASDVSLLPSLPESSLPKDVVAAKKKPFLDLLDPKFGLAGAGFPEKIEGLAFGPDLPDGRHVLIVTSDNDFLPSWPNWFWAFAIDPLELPTFTPQRFDGAH
jgi:hypothetical protein